MSPTKTMQMHEEQRTATKHLWKKMDLLTFANSRHWQDFFKTII